MLALSLALLFLPVLVGMAQEWWRNETFSHGFLVPFISGYLVWQRRLGLQAVRRSAPWGLWIVGGGLLLHALGIGAEVEFLSHLALLISLGGVLLFAWGPAAFRLLAFPYAFLYFMAPWPDTLVEFLSFPMQLLSAKFAAMLVGMLGIPVTREGVDLHLARYSFTVAAPCSGMRSLVALLALAALTAFVLHGPRRNRVTLFLLGLPLALVANFLRITCILLLAHFWGKDVAEGFFHSFSGLLVFLLATAGLLLTGRALGLTAGVPATEPATCLEEVREHPTPPLPMALSRRTQTAASALAVVSLGLFGLFWMMRPTPPAGIAKLTALPIILPNWKSEDLGSLDRTSAEMLQPDAYLRRMYTRADGYPVEVSVLLGHRKQTFHSPGFCLLGGGWNITRKSHLRIPISEEKAIEANLFWLSRKEEQRIVVYWYASYRETTPRWVTFQYRLLRNRLLSRPKSGALIRLVAPVAESPQEAEGVAGELAGQLAPYLEKVLWQ